MAKSKEQFISDVILQLTQSAPTDDIAIEEDQIAAWGSDFLNDLIQREIVSEIKKGKSIPPIYITRETGLELAEESVADIDDEDQRMYLELTGEVLEVPGDRGIVKVLDYDLNLIHKTSTENLEILNDLRFSKPTLENPLYYREGQQIFIKGFNTADLEFNEFIVHYVQKQNLLTMGDEDEIKATDQLLNVLSDLTVQKGKLELYGTQPDTASDSVDRKTPVYHTAISNPTKNDGGADNQNTEQ